MACLKDMKASAGPNEAIPRSCPDCGLGPCSKSKARPVDVSEEVALLRRELADLRDRVSRMEAGSVPVHQQTLTGPVKINAQVLPCLCAPGALCANSTCPRRGYGPTTGITGG